MLGMSHFQVPIKKSIEKSEQAWSQAELQGGVAVNRLWRMCWVWILSTKGNVCKWQWWINYMASWTTIQGHLGTETCSHAHRTWFLYQALEAAQSWEDKELSLILTHFNWTYSTAVWVHSTWAPLSESQISVIGNSMSKLYSTIQTEGVDCGVTLALG
jgi:hypothetical protein